MSDNEIAVAEASPAHSTTMDYKKYLQSVIVEDAELIKARGGTSNGSKYQGVTKTSDGNSWQAQIKKVRGVAATSLFRIPDDKQAATCHLGRHDEEIEAARWYTRAHKKRKMEEDEYTPVSIVTPSPKKVQQQQKGRRSDEENSRRTMKTRTQIWTTRRSKTNRSCVSSGLCAEQPCRSIRSSTGNRISGF